jgi:hypothetical protein
MSRAPKLGQFDTLGEEIDVPPRPAFWSESRSWNPENTISDGGGSCVVFIIAMSGGIAAQTIRGGRIAHLIRFGT